MVLRNRVLSGLFLALPILITFFVIQWLYDFLAQRLILPIASQVALWWETNQTGDQDGVSLWITQVLAPLIAVFIILSILFLLGMFFKSRVHRLIDWIFLQVPFVNTIYKSVKQHRNQAIPACCPDLFPTPGCQSPCFCDLLMQGSSDGADHFVRLRSDNSYPDVGLYAPHS